MKGELLMIDLVGQTFGRLTVLARAPTKNKKTYWHCVCSCENKTELDVEAYNLKSGHTKSCGCLHGDEGLRRLNDLTGQKFGRLTVLRRDEDYVSPKGKHHVKWVCQCDCEKHSIISVSVNSLRNGHTTSCGCFLEESRSEVHKKYNDYKIVDDYVIMYTSKGEEFYVDLEDFDKVKDICWHMTSDGYLANKTKDDIILLHRLVMDCPENLQVDHIGGNVTKNDNRKSNLRLVTQSQNNMNRNVSDKSPYGVTGVYFIESRQKWCSEITEHKKKHHLGYYDSFEDAVRARKNAEELYFGQYSWDNSQIIKKENEDARKSNNNENDLPRPQCY